MLGSPGKVPCLHPEVSLHMPDTQAQAYDPGWLSLGMDRGVRTLLGYLSKSLSLMEDIIKLNFKKSRAGSIAQL